MSDAAPIRHRDEGLKGDDADQVVVAEEGDEAALGVEAAQLPARPAEDEVGAGVAVAVFEDGLDEAHRLEGDLLLRGAGGLLPFQRDQVAATAPVVGDDVDDMPAAAQPLADPRPVQSSPRRARSTRR